MISKINELKIAHFHFWTSYWLFPWESRSEEVEEHKKIIMNIFREGMHYADLGMG